MSRGWGRAQQHVMDQLWQLDDANDDWTSLTDLAFTYELHQPVSAAVRESIRRAIRTLEAEGEVETFTGRVEVAGYGDHTYPVYGLWVRRRLRDNGTPRDDLSTSD